MKNGRWYLVYTKTRMEYDEMAGCCGGVGSGGAFIDVKKSVSIALEAATAKLVEIEAKKKWEKIRADIEDMWEKNPKQCGWNYTRRGFLDSEASDPRIVFRFKSRIKNKAEASRRIT